MEPTPLVTVLPCEAEKARDILQRERGSALWLNDDEVIRAMVRFAHDARLAALEEGREQAAGLAEMGDWDSWSALATAIRALSNKTADDVGRVTASPGEYPSRGWVRIPVPTLADLSTIGEIAEGGMLSELGWAEVGRQVWRHITTDAEISDWSGSVRGKFHRAPPLSNKGGRDGE